jgi:hypothetical protein
MANLTDFLLPSGRLLCLWYAVIRLALVSCAAVLARTSHRDPVAEPHSPQPDAEIEPARPMTDAGNAGE